MYRRGRQRLSLDKAALRGDAKNSSGKPRLPQLAVKVAEVRPHDRLKRSVDACRRRAPVLP